MFYQILWKILDLERNQNQIGESLIKRNQIRESLIKRNQIRESLIKRNQITTNNNTLNISTCLDFDNIDKIKNVIEHDFDINYAINGQKGIKKKTVDVTSKWYTDDSGSIDMDKFDIMMEPQQSILKIKDDNNTFKKELASLTVWFSESTVVAFISSFYCYKIIIIVIFILTLHY